MLSCPDMLLRYFFRLFSTIPVVPIKIGIKIFHLLSGLLNVFTGYCHIYYHTLNCILILNNDVWFVTGCVSVSCNQQVLWHCYFFILHYSVWSILMFKLCIHLDSIVLADILMELSSYLVVPVKAFHTECEYW